MRVVRYAANTETHFANPPVERSAMTAAITACPAFSQAYETAAGTKTVQQVRALGAAAEADVIAARRLFHRFP